MWKAEKLGEQDSGLSMAHVVGLKAGKHQVGAFRLYGCGEKACDGQCIPPMEIVAGNVQGSVCALGEGVPQDSLRAVWTDGECDDFASVLLFQQEGLLQRVSVRLIECVLEVAVFDPFSIGRDSNGSSRFGDLLQGYYDLHAVPFFDVGSCYSCRQNIGCQMLYLSSVYGEICGVIDDRMQPLT